MDLMGWLKWQGYICTAQGHFDFFFHLHKMGEKKSLKTHNSSEGSNSEKYKKCYYWARRLAETCHHQFTYFRQANKPLQVSFTQKTEVVRWKNTHFFKL